MNNQTQPMKDFPQSNKPLENRTLEKGAEAVRTAEEKLENVYSSAKDTMDIAGKKISHGYEVASREIRRVGSQFEGAVRKNPLIAVGVAVTLGWVAGRFLSSRMAERT